MNKKKKITSILNNAKSLIDIFLFYKKNFPLQKFLFKKEKNNWIGKSFLEIYKNVQKLSYFFKESGVKKGDRIFLLSSNRIEWAEIDLGIMFAGAITVPSFVTNNTDDNNFIIKNCSPKLIILENFLIYKKNEKFLKKYKNSKIILIEKHDNFISYKEITTKETIDTKPTKIIDSDISTIIYTSGTSSYPKGVVLSHKSLIHNLRSALVLLEEFGIKQEKFISFLPLSHSYERMAGLYFPLLIGAQIFFCSSLDKLMLEIEEVKPTIVSAVPRLYENIYKKIKIRLLKNPIFSENFVSELLLFLEGKTTKNYKKIFFLIFKKLFIEKNLKRKFGGKIKVFISGGAALSPEVGFFFNKIGFILLQGYGQTEASPLISCNTKQNNDPKTVGFPVKGVNVKISNDGEILVKGLNVMNGYWNDSSLTKKTIINNWLHTGDLGFFDNIGRLVINGRKKDLIVTSGGDNIAVHRIENLLCSQIEIDQAIVFGDNKPFLIAIIVKNDEIKLADLKGVIENLNRKLNSIEKIKKYILAEKPFSYENGLLTQTQKIKREQVYKFYSEKIKKLYRD